MPKGGKRNGAGRPKGGQYGESTKTIRIPVSQEDRVLKFIRNKEYALPIFACGVSAGFPSPADDYQEGSLDLNEHLIRQPADNLLRKSKGRFHDRRRNP